MIAAQATAIRNLGGLWIDGEEVEATAGETLLSLDPSTGAPVAEVAMAGPADVDRAVEAAWRCRRTDWRDRPPVERGRILARIAGEIRAAAGSLAELDAYDAGLPLRLARADVATAARYFEFYAGACDKLTGESIPLGPGLIDFTIREPYGVCGVIAPFNVPLQMVARSVAAALAAGNCVVVKTAEEAPLPTLALARLFAKAGLPAGAVNLLPGLGGVAGAHLASHPEIRHLTFTGSEATGRLVLEAAARTVTPVTLELGGKSPQIVFADADPEAALDAIVASTVTTAGQVCSAGTRILVEDGFHDEFAAMLAARIAAIEPGPAIADPGIGPLISERQRDSVLAAVADGEARGVRVLAGGTDAERPRQGFFVAPTLFGEVGIDDPLAQREIFGPVLATLRFSSLAEAIEIADATPAGLVAGVWTRDLNRALALVEALEAGQVFVNDYGAGGGVELPFGGYRRGGFGREKGTAALLEYTQVKNVCLRHSTEATG